MNTFIVTVREASRNQKKIFEQVIKTKKSAVVINKSKGPQVAIVSLEDLKTLEKIKSQKSAQILFKLADLGEKYPRKKHPTNAVEDTKAVWNGI